MPDYTYWQSEPSLWTVGFIAPGGGGVNRDRHPESDHGSPAAAAARVRWLNGGNDDNTDVLQALRVEFAEAHADGASSNDIVQLLDDFLTARGLPTVLYA
jgi:hypothetical protein